MVDKNILGQRIKEVRLSKSLTLQDVGLIVGTSKAVLSNVENGKKGVSLDILIALADYFGVSLDYLVGRSDVPHVAKEEEC